MTKNKKKKKKIALKELAELLVWKKIMSKFIWFTLRENCPTKLPTIQYCISTIHQGD